MKRWLVVIIVILGFSCAPKMQENLSKDVAAQDIQTYIKYLASPELAGRRAGTDGNRKAAEYIKEHYEADGLEPAGDNGSFFQEFDFVDSIQAGSDNSMIASFGPERKTTLEFGKDFSPLGFTSDTTITAPVVFAGYGISAADSLHYDDYAGIDVKGKIVAMFRSGPSSAKTGPMARFISNQAKTMTARQHGAIGMIMMYGPLDSAGNDKLNPLRYERGFGNAGLAAVSMTIAAFDSLLAATSGQTLAALQKSMNDSNKPLSFEMPSMTLTLHTQIVRIKSHTMNVAAFLPGNDPALKGQILVIGAHFDHLGMGGEGSLKPDTVAIHPGADDNASGTAGVLEAAQYFSARRAMLKRSILFLSFTGEELGLLGSDWFANHPTKPLDSMVTMMNMDMIGRLKDNALIVEGMGSSPQFESLARRENIDSTFKLQLKPDAFGPSDHTSFSAKKMPVMFFFTNVHDDYHKPSDTWDKINYPGEQKVVEYVTRIATDIDTTAEKPAYQFVAPPMASGRGEFKVSLGVVPDMASDVVGMKISAVRPGGAAEAAGLQANDIIVKFADTDIKNLYDYTAMLGKFKPGDTVTLVIKRGDKEVTVNATFKKK